MWDSIMSDRYEAQLLKNETVVLRYSLGYTKVEVNNKTGKTIVRNLIGDSWVPHQFDEIFGLGEYKKFSKHIIERIDTPSPGNPHSIEVVLVGAYIPRQAKKDITTELGDKNLIGKYFK